MNLTDAEQQQLDFLSNLLNHNQKPGMHVLDENGERIPKKDCSGNIIKNIKGQIMYERYMTDLQQKQKYDA